MSSDQTSSEPVVAPLLDFKQFNPRMKPDQVLSPDLGYDAKFGGGWIAWENSEQNGFVRATFEGWDAQKVARGEYEPYPYEFNDSWSPLATVGNSPWLRERYEYEKRFYASAYEWGGSVEEMLTKRHFLFLFHDEFVEVIADGVWLELSDQPFDRATPLMSGHPLSPLGKECVVAEGVHAESRYEIRANKRPVEELMQDVFLCSQPIYEVYTGLVASGSGVNRSPSLKYRVCRSSDVAVAFIRQGSWGQKKQANDNPPSLEQILAEVEQELEQWAVNRRINSRSTA